MQPEYELPSPIRFRQFQMFAKIKLGYCPPATLRTNYARGLVRSYLRVRLCLPSSDNFGHINGVAKLGASTLIKGHTRHKKVQIGAIF